MFKFFFSVFLVAFFSEGYSQTNPKFEIQAGLVGQFYINKSINRQENAPMGFLRMHGSDGTLASVGLGVGITFLYSATKNLSFSITPTFRLASLETPNPQGLYGPERIGVALDLHSGVQWKLGANNLLFKKSALGLGLSLLNTGQSYNTYYTWVINVGKTGEYRATTLMTLGINSFYEKKLSTKFTLKLMVIYTVGDFIKWTPLYKYTLHGNVSVNYNIFQ